MKFEFSAGGIVFKKPERKKDSILILVAQHSYHHGWVFPKGLIGDKEHNKGEKKEVTAVREVEEETGVKAKIIAPLEKIAFWYKFEGETIKKTVYYFIMEYIEGDTSKHDMEMENVEFIPIDRVKERITYKSDREVFIKALPQIEKLASS